MSDLLQDAPVTIYNPATKERLTKEQLLARLGQYGKKGKRKRKPVPTETPLTQFTVTQQAIYNLVKKHKEDIKELAVLVPLLNGLEDRRQVLAGHGKPKPVEASNEPRKARARTVAAPSQD